MTVEEAKEVLRQAGYYVDNLWSTDDVFVNHPKYDCVLDNKEELGISKEEAQSILNAVMHSEYTIGEINQWISDEIEYRGK